MSKNLEQILGAKNLIGLIQARTPGLPTDVLPPGFLAAPENVRGTEGNTAVYTRVYGTRKTARLVHYGSPAIKRDLTGIEEIPVALLHTLEEVQIRPNDLANLLAEDNPTKQALGAQTVGRQIGDFRTLFTNLRIAALYSALFKGAIWFDGAGNLLASSSGAKITVDFAIPASHKGQLGGIIDASWAADGTDILGHLVKIKKASVREYGAPLKYAFYGEAVPEMLASNTAIKGLVAGDPTMSAQVARGEMPDIGGLKWLPGYNAYYQKDDGTDTDLCGSDAVVFTPEPAPEWLEWIEGTYPIPTNLNVLTDALEALRSLSLAQGMFSYAAMTHNPPGITQYAGDTMIVVIKVPNAVYIADVIP